MRRMRHEVSICSTYSTLAKGFTLIELISVMVILALVASIGSRFLVIAVDSYQQTQDRTKIVGKGRAAIEQMSRQLRGAVPNSIRISATGRCVEFLPTVAGANYVKDVADEANMATGTSSIETSRFTLGLGVPAYAVIGAYQPSEIYTFTSPSSRVDLAAPLSGGSFTSVNFSGSHKFKRNSTRKRVFIAAMPRRFCVLGTELFMYSGYTLLTILSDTPPADGLVALMASNVAANGVAFVLSSGTQDRNAALEIEMQFMENNSLLTLNQQVLLRNVP